MPLCWVCVGESRGAEDGYDRGEVHCVVVSGLLPFCWLLDGDGDKDHLHDCEGRPSFSSIPT